MWGIILAAGKGHRMLPITFARPKSSLPFKGKPIIRTVAESLSKHTSRLGANLHHLPWEILKDLAGMDFVLSLEAELLGTCGGLRRMVSLFGIREDVLVQNGDTVLLTSYEEILRHHRHNPYPVTLALCPHRPPYTPIRVDGGHLKIGEGHHFYCGVMVISGEVLHKIPPSGNLVLDFAAKLPVGAVEAEVLEFTEPSGYLKAHGQGEWVEEGAKVHETALIQDSVIMRDGEVGRGAAVVNSVVVRGKVPPGEVIKGGIFIDGKVFPLP